MLEFRCLPDGVKKLFTHYISSLILGFAIEK